VPKALFDSVADNLLQNALAKRASGHEVDIRVSILKGNDAAELRVSDSGRAVPADMALEILRAPVRSGGGLGIGLYQASRHAEESGYVLTLSENRDGAVCFALSRATG